MPPAAKNGVLRGVNRLDIGRDRGHSLHPERGAGGEDARGGAGAGAAGDLADLDAQMRVKFAPLHDARCGAAMACGRQLASWRIERTPSVLSISMMRSGVASDGISMRAKWTLTCSGTARGYHASTTELTLGTVTPIRTSSDFVIGLSGLPI